MSQKHKDKIGKAHKGKKRSQQARENISLGQQNRSREHRDKISKANKDTATCRDLRTGKYRRIPKEKFYTDDLFVGVRSKKPNLNEGV